MKPAFAAALLAALLAATSPALVRAEEDEAARIARDLAGAHDALDRVRRRESTALLEVDRAEATERAAIAAAGVARREAERAAEGEARALGAERTAQDTLQARLNEVAPRLLVRYRLLRQGRASVLLSATSAADLVRRDAALDRVLAADVERVRRAAEARDDLVAARVAAAGARAEAARRAGAATAATRLASVAADTRHALLEGIRGERALEEQTIEELARAQEDLARTVAALGSGEASGFLELKGKLPLPVAGGAVEVPYGKMVNPRFNTVTFHRGLDVRGPENAEVTAVAAGRVVHAGWFGGYGNLVIVDHGAGYHSLYAHLGSTSRQVGDEVGAGEPLGLLGDTGSLKGPYLYFEVREQGKPVDPRDWLARTR